MTVTTKKPVSGPFIANGSNRSWDFQFKIQDASQITIIVRDANGQNEQQFDTGIDVAPQYLNNDTGGKAVFPAAGQPAIEKNKVVLVARIVPFHQPNRIGNQGRYYAETHEDTFDLLEMQIQQIAAILERAVKVPDGAVAPIFNVPSPSNLLFVDDSGTVIESETGHNEKSLREDGDRALGIRIDGLVSVVAGEADRAEKAADRSEAARDESEYHAQVSHDLVEAAVAGFQGFVDGMGYDFGWLSSDMTYFNRDWGTL